MSIRATAKQKALLQHASRVVNTSVSQFVLRSSIEAAHIVLMDQTSYLLSSDQWEEFCNRLDEPARVIPQLRQLFREQDSF